MNEYVEVVRHFYKLTQAVADSPTRFLPAEKRTTWANLLRPTAVDSIVLIAASGSGKSTELEQEARRRQRSGQHAVFCIAAALADRPLRDALGTEDAKRFSAWEGSTEPLILFVDAVDELLLRHRDPRDALGRIDNAIDFATRDVQLVLSARTGTWLQAHTSRLKTILRRGRSNEPVVQLYSFESLDEQAIRAFVAANDITDIESFMQGYGDDEVDSLFEVRPSDIRFLATQWKTKRRFGRWSELLEQFVTNALDEESLERQRGRTISTLDGQAGFRRIGAACVLGKNPYLSIPTAARSEAGLSSRRLFDDWTIEKSAELFESSLFVHNGMEGRIVQLGAGALAPYLASRWFADRVRGGLSIDDLAEVLLVRTHGSSTLHVPRSRSGVIGWIASELPDFRSRIISVWPEGILYEGDPDRLTDRDIETALVAVCSAMNEGRQFPRPTRGTLRKLARATIEPVVSSLLSVRPISLAAQSHLLDLAKHGRYASCATLAGAIASDGSASEHLRAQAIATVIAAGSLPERASLAALATDPSFRVRTALLPLVPAVIQGSDLLSLVDGASDLEFRYYFGAVVKRLSDPDLDLVLEKVAFTLSSTTRDSATESALSIALPVLTERMRRGPTDTAVAVARGIEKHLDRHHSGIYIAPEEIEAARSAVMAHEAVRRQLYELRLDDASLGALGETITRLVPQDLPWLVTVWSAIETTGDEPRRPGPISDEARRKWEIERTIDDLLRQVRPDEAAATRAILPESILARIHAAEQNALEREAERARREMEALEVESSTRNSNVASIRPRLESVAAGSDVEVLLWAWRQLDRPHGEARGRRDLTPLAKVIGDDLLPVFLQGFKAFWRKHDVPIPDPASSSTLLVHLMGLTGLTLDVADGLDLGTLVDDEAELAARYALYELNAFPTWFDELVAAHPRAVTKTLRTAISQVWASPSERITPLRFASYSSASIARVMREVVLGLATDTNPMSRQALEDAVDALITSGGDEKRVASIARRGLKEGSADDERAVQWFRLLAHVEPIGAAALLMEIRESAPPRFLRLIELVASALEHDLGERSGATIASQLLAPEALRAWVELLFVGIAPKDDLRHEDGVVYARGARDAAQDLRRRCLDLLVQDVSEVAQRELLALLARPTMQGYRAVLGRAAEEQRQRANENAARTWSEDEVLALERGDERPPKTVDDLLALVRAHIAHVDRLVSDDDFSYRSLFRPSATLNKDKTKEREIQLWAASCIRERARGLYSMVRENVVDDDKEVDISALAAGVGQIPIEIKPLGPYSFEALKKVLEKQLIGQYMRPRERTCGVLLLVRRERKKWQVGPRMLDLSGMLGALRDYARAIGAQSGKTVVVDAIDLLERAGSSSDRGLPR